MVYAIWWSQDGGPVPSTYDLALVSKIWNYILRTVGCSVWVRGCSQSLGERWHCLKRNGPILYIRIFPQSTLYTQRYGTSMFNRVYQELHKSVNKHEFNNAIISWSFQNLSGLPGPILTLCGLFSLELYECSPYNINLVMGLPCSNPTLHLQWLPMINIFTTDSISPNKSAWFRIRIV